MTIAKAKGTGKQPITIDDSDDDIVETKPVVKASSAKQTTPEASSSAPTLKGRTSMPAKRRIETDDEDEAVEAVEKKPVKRQAVTAAKPKPKKPNYLESSSEEEEQLERKPQKATPKNGKGKKAASVSVDMASDG